MEKLWMIGAISAILLSTVNVSVGSAETPRNSPSANKPAAAANKPSAQAQATQNKTQTNKAQTQATTNSASPASEKAAESPAQSAPAPKLQQIVLYDFENDLQGWTIPDWAKESPDYNGELTASKDKGMAAKGAGSAKLMVDLPGNKWMGGYIERQMNVRDFTPYEVVAVDVFVPQNASADLQARIILTVGDQWTWTEMNHGVPLQPGKWTQITANLMPSSEDWAFFPDETFRKDIRKMGVRVESEKTAYKGPVYVDHVRLIKQ